MALLIVGLLSGGAIGWWRSAVLGLAVRMLLLLLLLRPSVQVSCEKKKKKERNALELATLANSPVGGNNPAQAGPRVLEGNRPAGNSRRTEVGRSETCLNLEQRISGENERLGEIQRGSGINSWKRGPSHLIPHCSADLGDRPHSLLPSSGICRDAQPPFSHTLALESCIYRLDLWV